MDWYTDKFIFTETVIRALQQISVTDEISVQVSSEINNKT
jgi:hypothetical protein